MSPKAVCNHLSSVLVIVILRNALLVENLDLIPGYRCSEQQDAAEFLNGVITGINGLFAKQRLCKPAAHFMCYNVNHNGNPQSDKPTPAVYQH